MTDEEFEIDAAVLRALDDALRFSAQAAGWVEPDTTQEGLLPEDHIQEHPEGVLTDYRLDQLPDYARFIGWATWTLGPAGEIVITADGVDLGTWPKATWLELLRQYREADRPRDA